MSKIRHDWDFTWRPPYQLVLELCVITLGEQQVLIAPDADAVRLLGKQLLEQHSGKGVKLVEGRFNDLGEYWIHSIQGMHYAEAEAVVVEHDLD